MWAPGQLRDADGAWLLPAAELLLCRVMALELSVPAQVSILTTQPQLCVSDELYRRLLHGRLRHFALGLRCLPPDTIVGVNSAAPHHGLLRELQALRERA